MSEQTLFPIPIKKEDLPLDFDRAKEIAEGAIEAAKMDPGAPFEMEVVEALRLVAELDPAQYMRYRHQMKKAAGVLVTELDRAVKQGNHTASEQESIADAIVNLVKEAATLFHDPDGTCYASFEQNGHIETWALGSWGFNEWASFRFYTEFGKAPRDASLKDAIGTLSGIARFEGEEQEVSLRTAKHGEAYYIDLCDESWSAIEVTSSGWRTVANPPVRFRRTKTMKPLPMPIVGGDIRLLWRSINIPEDDRDLVLAWCLECFRSDTQFPILELSGEQGSGKSDTQSKLRDLIDPNDVNLRAAPSKVEDIFVGAGNNWLVSLNNLSRLTAAQQDAFCTLSTGGGYAGRALFTNKDESLIEAKRPVVFNGISALATAPDLVDRTLRIELPRIKQRRKSSAIEAEFEANKAAIFGGLLDLFVEALSKLPHVDIENLPRMADFAAFGEAIYHALGRKPGGFTEAYQAVQNRAVMSALESSPVSVAIQEYMSQHLHGFNGTVKRLLGELEYYRTLGEAWPKSPKGLADALRRQSPALRVVGIQVEFDKQHHHDGVHVNIKQRKTFFQEKDKTYNHVHDVHDVHAGKPDGDWAGEHREHGEHGFEAKNPHEKKISEPPPNRDCNECVHYLGRCECNAGQFHCPTFGNHPCSKFEAKKEGQR
ncbi:hypothetical protein [Nitrosococcus wardiae]|uniref:ATP-binding protein n=1 Tax=Nitrosococcus wardiae TaxID=1814290 RepID=A0A4P7BXI7_9GAMM|nr:hypothetical protein [Nitrosococcus wardiae]QBQ53830.1 hypothetical protein E3U44_04365 [Nitrosococcus wardiae]